MSKKCSMEGCNEEIDVWKNFCSKHYVQMMSQDNSVVDEPPKIPVSKPVQRQPLPKQMQTTEIRQQLEEKKVAPMLPNSPKDNNSILIRQKCLEMAIEFKVATSDLNKEYEPLMQEIEVLTDRFEAIITKKA